MIFLWKGYHSETLLKCLQKGWEKDDLVILCPPLLKDFSFLKFLPPGEVKQIGEWSTKLDLNPLRENIQYPEQPVLGVFTSGTISGSPRLVLYSKRNIETSLEDILSFFDSSQLQTIFCYPQAFHTFGLILGYMHSLLKNRELVFSPGKYSSKTHEIRNQIQNEKTLTLGTPTHFKDWIRWCHKSGVKPRPSYTAIVGGASVSVSLWEELRTELHILKPSIGYGATEASPGITHLPPGHQPTEDGEIGFVLPRLSVEQASDQSGIRIQGSSVCLAIIQNQEIEFPKAVLIRDRLLKRPADGVWIYQGRADLILNRGGQKFSLENMEQWVEKKFQVPALCVSVPDSRLGEELGILFGKVLTENQLNQIFSSLIQEYGSSFNRKYFACLSELPLNASSKVDRLSGKNELLKTL